MIVIFAESPQTFTWRGSQNYRFICRNFAFRITKGCPSVEIKSKKTEEKGISHLRENGPQLSEEQDSI